MTELEQKAMGFAITAHGDQKRKYTGEPYWQHCQEVANIVRFVDGTPEMIAAAWLHDTVEDCDVSLVDIFRLFGVEIGRMVENLTDISQPVDGNRRRRKEKDRQHTAGASPDAKTIKLADLISNSRTIVPLDPEFAVVYMKEKKLLLDVLTEGNPVLYSRAKEILLDYESGRVQRRLGEMDAKVQAEA